MERKCYERKIMKPTKPSPDRKIETLEIVRGLAALYVFLHHAILGGVFPGAQYLSVVTKFGQAAVLVFFFISGFVIYHATVGRHHTPREYFLLRLRRIYPLYLVAILAAWVSTMIYKYHHFFWPDAHDLLVNLLLLQDRPNPGNWAQPFLGLIVLWSLSYEWCFYMAFLPTLWLAGARPERARYVVFAISLAALALYAVVPNPIAMFLTYYVIWWAGAEIAREWRDTGVVTIRGQAFSFFAMVVIGASYAGWVYLGHYRDWWDFPGLQARHFAEAIAIYLFGFAWYKLGGIGFRRLLGWGLFFAPFSYGLYVIHGPFIWLALSMPRIHPIWLNVVWLVPVVLGTAWFLELKVQPAINRLFPIRRKRQAPAVQAP
jgi:peptidoglycan/LPS O-acetylase OafA/YrhL